ncbi:MAG TPA: type I restriction enzyme endonuclease domain-containing protein [Nakamurella sp.]
MGTDTLAQIARDLVEIMRRDVRTDWTVRDDVRAKLVHQAPPRQVRLPTGQAASAIKAVMDQMELMVPPYASSSERS